MLRGVLILFASLSVANFAPAAYDWPTRVVPIEEMKMITPMVIGVPTVRTKGKVRGPVVLRVHVDKTGAVQHSVLLESCGSPAHDEAAMHSMRAVRFVPKVIDGVPEDVTLVVPLHLPLSKT